VGDLANNLKRTPSCAVRRLPREGHALPAAIDSIGFLKHIRRLACSGDVLLELDHDDLLTEDCLAAVQRPSPTNPRGLSTATSQSSWATFQKPPATAQTTAGATSIQLSRRGPRGVRGFRAQPRQHVRVWYSPPRPGVAARGVRERRATAAISASTTTRSWRPHLPDEPMPDIDKCYTCIAGIRQHHAGCHDKPRSRPKAIQIYDQYIERLCARWPTVTAC